MKKQKLILLLLSAVLLVLLLFLVLFLNRGGSDEDSVSDGDDGQKVLAEADPDQIASVNITNLSGTYTVSQADGQTTLEHYADVPLDEEALETLFHYASVIRSRQKLSGAQALSQYALDKPEASAHIVLKDGSSYDVSFGSQVPGQDTAPVRYMLYEGTVYTTFQLYAAPFFLSEAQYIDHQVTPVSRNVSDARAANDTMLTVTSVNVRDETGFSYAISLAGTEGVMGYTLRQYTLQIQDDSYPYSTDSVGTEVLASFLNLYAEDIAAVHPDAGALAEYHLDTPFRDVELSWKDADGLEGSLRFLLSRPQDGRIYAMRPDTDMIYRLNGVPLFCGTDCESLISTYLLMPALSDLSGVRLEAGGREYRFQVDMDRKQITYEEELVPLDSFRDFYERLIQTKADRVLLEPVKTDELPAAGRVAYEGKNGTVQEILLYTLSPRKLLAKVNGIQYELSATKWEQVTAGLDSLN